jgi:hypothetical protein
MTTQSADTHPGAEKVLIELQRGMSPAEKLNQVRSQSRVTIALAKRAIARANRELGEQEVDLLFIRLHYGEPLAQRVKEYLKKRLE